MGCQHAGLVKSATSLLEAPSCARCCWQSFTSQFSIPASIRLCGSSISTSARCSDSAQASSSAPAPPAHEAKDVSALIDENAAKQFVFKPRDSDEVDFSDPWSVHNRGKLNRADWYHRRHRKHKKAEKARAPEEFLLWYRNDLASRPGTRQGIAAVDAQLDYLRQDWSQKNLPVQPRPAAAVAPVASAKVVSFDEKDLASLHEADRHLVKRKLDVLTLKVGYGKDVEFALPDSVKAFVLEQSLFCLYGIDKNQVSQIASRIRKIRPPEPYKGAGIRIVGESIKLRERKGK